jgi:SNF2 family DNA or RNA helicase
LASKTLGASGFLSSFFPSVLGLTVVAAVNEADKQNKLLQIACGFVYSRGDQNKVVTQHVDCSSRLSVLDEILDTLPGKAIIFVPYTELIDILEKHLSPRGKCATVFGEVSKNDRVDIFRSFQQTDEIKYIIAHPKTMAHGITLTAAATIIWYAPYASNEIYEQANGRINRPSQVRSTNIVHIGSTELEKRIYRRLAKRQNTQGTLLDYLAEIQSGKQSY